MEWVKILLGFLREVLPTLTTFIVGRKSKELEDIRDENRKLKKYEDIDNDEPTRDDVYNAGMWK